MKPPFSLHFDDDKYSRESFIIFPKCEESIITQGGEVGLLEKVTRRRLLSSSLQSDSTRSNVVTAEAGTLGEIIVLGTGNMEYKDFSLLLQRCGK